MIFNWKYLHQKDIQHILKDFLEDIWTINGDKFTTKTFL